MYFVSHVLFSLYLTAPDIVAMEEEEEAREEEPPPPEEEEEVFGGSIGQCSYCNYLFFFGKWRETASNTWRSRRRRRRCRSSRRRFPLLLLLRYGREHGGAPPTSLKNMEEGHYY